VSVTRRFPVQPPPDPVFDRTLPEGFHHEWVKDEGWRLATPVEQDERKCRRPGCKRVPVAALLRPRWQQSEGRNRKTWWLYCDWHLYGRRIENGRVEFLRAVRDEEPL
jgi:hypothetical protein